MKIAKIAAAAMTVLCAVSFVSSCHKVKEETKKVAPVKEAEFTVGLNTVEAEYAEVVVRHTGAKDVSWFGFVTQDVETPEQELINAQLSQLDVKSLHVGTSQTVAVRDLQEAENYRYVAFAVNSSKETSGKPGSIIFNTSPKFDVTFGAEATEVGCHEASFAISHTGHEVLTYVGFVTENLTEKASVLAAADYATKVTDGKINEGVELLQGTAQAVTVDKLKDETSYRYIVYGIYDLDGTAVYYGTPADCNFTTPLDYTTVSFDAQLSNLTKSSVDFDVTYSAKKEDLTWYGFVTEDLTAEASAIVAAKVAAGISVDDYQSGAKKVALSGLTAETTYRFITTGITTDGTYGIPADVRFTTLSEAYDNTVFTVQATEVKPKSVTLTITHTGEEGFQYYGFFTTDLTSPVAQIAVPGDADQNLMSGKSKTITIDNLSPLTEYRYVVVGRVYGNEYGTRGDVKFTTGDYAVAASYDDFLGNWSMINGTPYDFTIEKKVNGQSYTISGLNGSTTARYGIDTPLVVEGKFVNGKLTIAIQAISAEYVDPDDNKTYTDMFCGRYVSATNGNTYYDKTVGQVVTTVVLLEDGTLELRAGSTKDNEAYTDFRFYQVPPSGSAYAQDSFATALPNAAKRPVPASEAYNKWLGNWNIAGVTYTVAKKEADKSYLVTGFYNTFYAEVAFDAATGNMVFEHKQMDYTVNASSGETYNIYTSGINSLNYVAVRQGADISLATFSLNSNGTSGNVTGVTYTHSEGETTVTEIGLLGYASSWTKWNGWNYITLPATISKASTSSVSSAPTAIKSYPGIDVKTVRVVKQDADKSYCRN